MIPRPPSSRAVLVALGCLVALSGALLLYLGSKLTFFLDDWEFLLYRPGFTAHAIFDPHGENIVVAPVLIYKALLATFGMGSALPYRVVSTLAFLLSAVLLFVLLRRRVGQWPALAATAVVLFLGAAWEDLLWPFQINYFGSMAAGLGMLLALERRRRGGDLLACLLLSVAVFFSSLGLPLAAGAAVEVLTREDRWRRVYVFLVPAAIYLAWYLGWGHTAESAISISNAGKTPLYVFDSLAASLGSLFGLASPWLTIEDDTLNWVRPLAAAATAGLLWLLYRRGGAPRWFWVMLAITLAFWALAGLNQIPGREAASSRYQYVGVVFLLLVAAELGRGVRFGRDWMLAIGLLATFSIASNLQALNSAFEHTYHPISRLEKADLGAIDIARGTVEPGFVLSNDIADTGFVHVEAGPYLAARDSYGTPAYDPAEIAASPRHVRFAADKVMFKALRIAAATADSVPFPSSTPTPATATAGVVAVPAGSCVSVASDGDASPLLSLPPTGATFRSPAPSEKVLMSRFSTGRFPITVTEAVPAGLAFTIATPPDRASQPWKVKLETTGTTVVCGLGDSA
jgi:hypothetical protein